MDEDRIKFFNGCVRTDIWGRSREVVFFIIRATIGVVGISIMRFVVVAVSCCCGSGGGHCGVLVEGCRGMMITERYRVLQVNFGLTA